jgi:hypothetical protein
MMDRERKTRMSLLMSAERSIVRLISKRTCNRPVRKLGQGKKKGEDDDWANHDIGDAELPM